ncbi:cobalamin-binding protein [Aeromonas caviae]|uniref:Cobalamin-binding protein n=1 Tax=Aeromonas caviae TaxID=648 RepID=A0A6S4TZX7_AERCA|nr:cobalamin-binding protein [Aeromonas caviae]MDH0433390.1 cobalamin-binding protein [Aeromonas caviae]MDH0936239.1 cobalamin-binding protein [Aeromonas caviae]MDH1397044.1 cobalamin-binding protein [Aeromonas caviae]MDH1507144.1 cobalamin-binding protein [Aeromonas caviae]MDH1804228.1 cobalamin-binding protein [Aeromonas caviae]
MVNLIPLRALCLLLCLLGWPLSGAATTPQRIISLTPHLTELLYDIGAGDRIVATDDASDFPPEVAPLPRVANYRSINLEALLAQNPDLVVAWRSAQSRMLAPVEKLGIPVFYSEPTDFASLADEMRSLGRLLGTLQKADQQADAYLARLDALTQRYGKPKPVSVFYQLWYPPLTSVNDSTWPGRAIKLCGGRNIMADANTPYPQVGLEQVIKANPGLILAGSRDPAVLAHWRQWSMLDAVKQQRLVLINPDELHRFTPRALNAVEQLCEAIEQAGTIKSR